MNYFIVDDDISVRAMLAEMIEDADLGTVAGERTDGREVDAALLEAHQVDILLIDLLMQERDGIETMREISGSYKGKTVMISQIESKELIGEAYSLGIEYYITKPLNRIEVVNILKKVNERLVLERSIESIQQSLHAVTGKSAGTGFPAPSKSIKEEGYKVLVELGMVGENGSRDLLDIIYYLDQNNIAGGEEITSLKNVYQKAAADKMKEGEKQPGLQREVKAAEQRVRRAVHQGISHIASVGLDDFSNPVFSKYASTFFDYEQVRKKMMELEKEKRYRIRVDTKKFIQMLYWEAKRRMQT